MSDQNRKLSPTLVGASIGAVLGFFMGKLLLGAAAGAGIGYYLSNRKKSHDT